MTTDPGHNPLGICIVQTFIATKSMGTMRERWRRTHWLASLMGLLKSPLDRQRLADPNALDLVILEDRILYSGSPVDALGGELADAFGVSSVARNEPPDISEIGDITIQEDTIAPELLFTVFDDLLDSDQLVVTAASDNQQLIPSENLYLDRTGDQFSLLLRPSENQSGSSATITLTAKDGNQEANETFRVFVAPVNDRPTSVGFQNVEISEGGSISIDLFAAFDDLEDDDRDMIYSVTVNTNPSLFSQIHIDHELGVLQMDARPEASGSSTLVLRATDSDGEFVEVETSDPITVFDSVVPLDGLDPVDTSDMGVEKLKLLTHYAFFDLVDNSYYPFEFNEEKFRAILQDLPAGDYPVVLDIENEELFGNHKLGRNNLAEVIRVAHDERPDMDIGYYTLFPNGSWWEPVRQHRAERDTALGLSNFNTVHAEMLQAEYDDWLRFNDEFMHSPVSKNVGGGTIVDSLDFFAPSLYTHYRNLANNRDAIEVTFDTETNWVFATGFREGDAIRFLEESKVDFPLNVSFQITYFVINVGETGFQLAYHAGGDPIDFVSTDASTNYAGKLAHWGSLSEDRDVVDWHAYAEENISLARREELPIISWISPTYAGTGFDPLEKEFFALQLDVLSELTDSIAIFDIQRVEQENYAFRGWLQAVEEFMKEQHAPQTSVTVSIRPVNDAPVALGIEDIEVFEGHDRSEIELSSYFRDKESDNTELTYEIVDIQKPDLFTSARIDTNGDLEIDYADGQSGFGVITVRATDTEGLFVDDNFVVHVQVAEGNVDLPADNNQQTIELERLDAEARAALFGNASRLNSVYIDSSTGFLVLDLMNDEPEAVRAIRVVLRDDAQQPPVGTVFIQTQTGVLGASTLTIASENSTTLDEYEVTKHREREENLSDIHFEPKLGLIDPIRLRQQESSTVPPAEADQPSENSEQTLELLLTPVHWPLTETREELTAYSRKSNVAGAYRDNSRSSIDQGSQFRDEIPYYEPFLTILDMFPQGDVELAKV